MLRAAAPYRASGFVLWHIPDIGPIADICVARTPNHVAIVRKVEFHRHRPNVPYAIRLFGCAPPSARANEVKPITVTRSQFWLRAVAGKGELRLDGDALPMNGRPGWFHPSRPLSLLGRSFIP